MKLNAWLFELTCPHCRAVYNRDLVGRLFWGKEEAVCLACRGPISSINDSTAATYRFEPGHLGHNHELRASRQPASHDLLE